MTSIHKPVLLKEVLEILQPQPGEYFIDGTYGGGGHSKEILKIVGPHHLLAVDWNELATKSCPVEILCAVGNFAELPQIATEAGFPKANGLLLDLGLSSDELENSGRGFSFQKNEPLLMTYNDSQQSVSEIIREKTKDELEKIIREFGEERFARKIAHAIKNYGNIKTTFDLVAAIGNAAPNKRGRLHPATRTFMALRIYANHELENLEALLNNLPVIMAPGGRVAIISFHSLEDRLVKNYFRNYAKQKAASLINKKPVFPLLTEIKENPRARSAKLRAIQFN